MGLLSIGDILTLVIALGGAVFTYGRLSQKVDNLAADRNEKLAQLEKIFSEKIEHKKEQQAAMEDRIKDQFVQRDDRVAKIEMQLATVESQRIEETKLLNDLRLQVTLVANNMEWLKNWVVRGNRPEGQ